VVADGLSIACKTTLSPNGSVNVRQPQV
jgi:hypothetical protein